MSVSTYIYIEGYGIQERICIWFLIAHKELNNRKKILRERSPNPHNSSIQLQYISP